MCGEAVSIIVPIYNAEGTLNRCIDSLINQTYENLEILLIDDGSNDLSLNICIEASKKDKRVKYFHQENEGVSVARNFGMKTCSGKWLVFVDADDELEKNAIQFALEVQREHNSELVCWNSYYVDDDKITKMNPIFPPIKNYFGLECKKLVCGLYESTVDDEYYGDFFRACWGKLYSVDFIKKNKIEFPVGVSIGEDALFLIQYFNKCNRILLLDAYLYKYYRTSESTIGRYKKDFYKIQKTEFEALERVLISEKIDFLNITTIFWHKAEKVFIENELKASDGHLKKIRRIIQYLNRDYVKKYLVNYDGKGVRSRIRSLLEKLNLCCVLATIDYCILYNKRKQKV